ncbi:hypothetical protein BDQ17DRAFT_1390656 [Cyathus striatus]|nr:hypothetical protein BDQ17DRAFT_1390656 [Cyathus striatus]
MAATRTSTRLAASGLLRPLTSTATTTPSTSSLKRDSLQAELERDPQLSTSKRLASAQAFKSTTSAAALERQLVILKAANGELEKKLRDKESAVDQLERDRRWLSDREKEEKESREREQKQWEEEKAATSTTLRSLRNQLSTLSSEFAELQDAHSTLSHRTSSTISSLKTQVATLTSQNASVQAELSDSRESEARKDAKIAELQDTLHPPPLRFNEEKVLMDELAKLSDHLRKLESKNMKMAAELAVLREEKRDLEKKLEVMEGMRRKVGELELELEETGENAETPPSSPSVGQTKELTSLRLHMHNYLKTWYHCCQSSPARSRDSYVEKREEELCEAIEDLRTQLYTREVKLKVMERKLALRLNKRIRSKITWKNRKGSESEWITARFAQASTARVKHLEDLLEQMKIANDDLLKEMKDRNGGRARANDEVLEELEKMKQERAGCRKAAREELAFELSGEIAGGRHVPPKTRILQLADNPEQRWFDLRQEAVDRLKGENEALLKRLEKSRPRYQATATSSSGEHPMEVEGRGRSSDLVPRESYELVAEEKKELENEVKQKEKRLLRLQQVYSSKTAEFREAIASILGSIRVTSLYDLGASFVFKPLSGPTTDDLPSMMHYWVETERCIPGFLASVTLECYDKMKREGGTGS